MNKRRALFLALLLFAGWSATTRAQEYNPIITAVPSLQIAPDAGGGMGDIGRRPRLTLPSIECRQIPLRHEPSFAQRYPAEKLTTGIHQLYASGYKQFGEGSKQRGVHSRFASEESATSPVSSGDRWLRTRWHWTLPTPGSLPRPSQLSRCAIRATTHRRG